MKTLLGLFLIMGIFSFTSSQGATEPLAVGAKAPTVTSVDENGAKVDLGEVFRSGVTVVYFYPKADTPGCTKQACSLRDSYTQLQEKGVKVIGVSADKPEAQKKFKEKYQLPFTLLADADGQVIDSFGVPKKNGYASRQAFLIKDGIIVWRDLQASTEQQAADVLKAMESLPK